MSAQGAGSILGGVSAVWVLKRRGPVHTVALGLTLLAVSAASAMVPDTTVVMLGSFAGGVAIPWAFVALATTRQRLTPAHLQGRVASATGMSLQIPQLTSIAVGAALVAAVDFRILIGTAGVVIAGAAVWLWTRRAAETPPVPEMPQIVVAGSPVPGGSSEVS